MQADDYYDPDDLWLGAMVAAAKHRGIRTWRFNPEETATVERWAASGHLVTDGETATLTDLGIKIFEAWRSQK